jgi:hypothetical protein
MFKMDELQDWQKTAIFCLDVECVECGEEFSQPDNLIIVWYCYQTTCPYCKEITIIDDVPEIIKKKIEYNTKMNGNL